MQTALLLQNGELIIRRDTQTLAISSRGSPLIFSLAPLIT